MTAPIKEITKTCHLCGKPSKVELKTVEDLEAYVEWKSGQFIQAAFWHWTPDQRELLISGTHPACWELLKPEDEEEN